MTMAQGGRITDVVMQATTFKARCLALLDEVARSHSTIVVTKHGKPAVVLSVRLNLAFTLSSKNSALPDATFTGG